MPILHTAKLPTLRLVALAGLAASAASVVDWLRPSPLFCGFASGCDQVTRSAYGEVAGVPLSALGVVAFALFLLVSLLTAPGARQVRVWLAALAGVAGVSLLVIQAVVLRQFCRVCLVADACGLLLAVIEFGLPPLPADWEMRPWRWAWVPGALLAVVAPLAWSALKPPPPVPEQVKRRWVEGKITVVVVTDFDCPACRATHPALEEALRDEGRGVHLVHLVFPLPDHTHARSSARAFHCARAQGKGEAMSQALFDTTDLSASGCEKLAEALALDLDRYRACVTDPATDAAIDAESSWVPHTGLSGLPIVWVQDQTFVGAQDADTLRAALRRARRLN